MDMIYRRHCAFVYNMFMKKNLIGALGLILTLVIGFEAASSDLSARGLIKAKSRAVLASEIGAVVNTTPLRSGDTFQKGDLLIGFDCRLLKSQRDKVAAQTKASKAQLTNARDLETMRSIGALDVTMAQADYDKAVSELKIATLNVERCSIRAPYDGTVVQLMVNEFESVDLRRNLIEIVSSSALEVEIIAPADWLKKISIGQTGQILVDELGISTEIKFVAIGGAVDPVSQTILVRAQLNNPPADILPGMSGVVEP